MTLPCQFLKEATYLATRRCLLRKFYAKPSKIVNNIFLYCLAYASERYNIQVHAYCFLSNHYHILLTDPDQKLPEFMTCFNAFTAKNLNVHLKRRESIWSPGSYSAVRIGYPGDVSQEDIIDKLLYIYTNPVRSGLVKYYHNWPGLISSPCKMDNSETEVSCPHLFFKPNSTMPKKAILRLTRPPSLNNYPIEDLVQLIKRKQSEIHAQFKLNRKTFMTPKQILSQSPFSTPKTPSPPKTISPRLACKNKWKRIELLRSLAEFLEKYKEAWNDFKKGKKDVVFPYGSYKMVKVFKFKCAPGPILPQEGPT